MKTPTNKKPPLHCPEIELTIFFQIKLTDVSHIINYVSIEFTFFKIKYGSVAATCLCVCFFFISENGKEIYYTGPVAGELSQSFIGWYLPIPYHYNFWCEVCDIPYVTYEWMAGPIPPRLALYIEESKLCERSREYYKVTCQSPLKRTIQMFSSSVIGTDSCYGLFERRNKTVKEKSIQFCVGSFSYVGRGKTYLHQHTTKYTSENCSLAITN